MSMGVDKKAKIKIMLKVKIIKPFKSFLWSDANLKTFGFHLFAQVLSLGEPVKMLSEMAALPFPQEPKRISLILLNIM